jgi:hypothetical protein
MKHEFRDKTVVYKDVELFVIYEYIPPEPMVRYYEDGSGYPGSDAEINIQEILCNDVDITELIEAIPKGFEDIEDLINEL